MIIDFHTHIFPDKIAERSIRKLEEVANIKAFTNGTLDGLKASMMENDIAMSIVLPVVTKPSQFDTVNQYAAKITGIDKIISFGGIHPDTEDYKAELRKIKSLGLPGIKLHPDYQSIFVDDPKMIRIIQYAAELGLIIILHAGIDIGIPDPVHCNPKQAANMLDQIECEDAKIILAHMGGFGLWDEVEKYIVGRKVWIDTSYSLGMIKDEQFERIVKNHGADRVLFATDSPWGGQGESAEHFKKLNFTEVEMERVLCRNALELLGMA